MDVVGDDHAYEWSLEGQRWLQDAHGKFTLTQVDGQALNSNELDLDFLVGARQTADGAGCLPAAFSHCPYSGKALAPVAYDPQRRWLPPYGNGSGRRVVENDCKLDSAEQTIVALFDTIAASPQANLNDHAQSISLPRKNGLNFLVANLGGHREALFALDREGGLFLWQRGAGQWTTLLPQTTPIGRSSLPNWAWGVSLREQDGEQRLLLAGDEGASEISVNPLSGRYRLERAPGKALGAPGDLDGQTFIPQQQADGSVCLIERSASGWQQHAIAEGDALRMSDLSAPLRLPSSRRLLWIGKFGYLSVKLGERVEAHWLSWPNGAVARPEYGPPFVDGYGTWQLLLENGKQVALRLDSDERKEITGSRLGTGHLNYQFNVRLDAPWAEFDQYTTEMTGAVVYPFVEFKDAAHHLLSFSADWQSSLQKFFDNAERLDVQYRLERIGRTPLNMLLKVSQPWNAQWFCYDNALWLYIDSSGALYRWNV
ncbi:hypothetical protein DCO48_21805 [Pseudomonas sp. SDI]|uniref:hypothetical protein n=1 Tax=Pseudomonas sp. SDI TaxID=2170734 RepID=UPI000DE6AB4D|nr:hypothetical protein [Pseudomonas sp. SDI]PWB29731.1 hypothetical protein DCO48_21805 [Pseudomonas sp. SDI]